MNSRRTILVTLILVTAAALVVPFTLAQHPPKPPEKEQKIVRLRGDQAWLNTGLRLRPQDRVTIKVTGKVCFSNGEKTSCVDAGGWNVNSYASSWAYNFNYCDDPLRSVNHAAVIANVGHPDFLVGRRLVFSGKDGALYVGINDCSFKGEYHNTGEFSVLIVVERNVVPKR